MLLGVIGAMMGMDPVEQGEKPMAKIVNQYEVTEKRYIQWILEAKKEGIRLAFTIFWSLMFVGNLVVSAVFGWDSFLIILAVFSGCMILPRDYFIGIRMYRRARLATGENVWKRTVSINEDEIVVNDGNTSTTFKTSTVVKVHQDPVKIRVFLNHKGSLRLYKDSFVEGTAEDCLRVLKA